MGERWTPKVIKSYAPYAMRDRTDPMNTVLMTLPETDRTLFMEAYGERRLRREMGAEWGISGWQICRHLTRIVDAIAASLN